MKNQKKIRGGGKYCNTPFCKNKRAKCRLKCWGCISRKKRKDNPMMASFQTLRANAKRRKKFFDLTFEQFKEFCYETAYMAGKGRTAQSFSVDCEINEKGYTYGNLKMRTVGDNSRKGKRILVYDWETGYATVLKD